MKVEKRNGGVARTVMGRMLVDAAVLGPIAARWDKDGLFGSRGENLVAGWAVAHYQKYGKAPGREIRQHFDRWAEHNTDPEVEDYVSDLLQGVSDEVKKNGKSVSSMLALDMAGELFDGVRQERLADQIAACRQRGDFKKANEIIAQYRRVDVGQAAVYDVYGGGTVAKNAIESRDEVLIKWDQEALRNFFGRMLARDQFIVYTAPEKRGKSFWLQETAFQANKCGRRVAFFEIGDQTTNQIYRRMIARAAGRPVLADHGVHLPVGMTAGEDGPPTVEHEVVGWEKDLTSKQGDDALYAVEKKFGRDMLRLSVSPNFTMTVPKMAQMLDEWKRDGWVADVVVVDYVDLFAPVDGRVDTREQINQNWKMLRAINQQLHCLLLTATQSDADGYDAETLDMGNFSEDKRKNAHCTGNVAINQKAREKKAGLYRLTWMYGRDLDIRTDAAVYTAPCLAMANPAVFSRF